MNLGIMHPTIEANQFELKSMIFQMLRTIGQFKKWLEVWWTWDANGTSGCTTNIFTKNSDEQGRGISIRLLSDEKACDSNCVCQTPRGKKNNFFW